MNDPKSNAKTWTERWTFVQELAPGAQGTAMKAVDSSGQVAFVKALKHQNDSERRARMYREISALSNMNVPGVPRLIESNADHYQDKEYELYLAAEFISGNNLDKAVTSGDISANLAVSLTISLCKTLSTAHDHGIFHRDIKPDNVIVTSRDDRFLPVLVDFGMASIEDSDDELSTELGQEVGNRFLRLPEFSAGSEDKRDARSDITFCVGLLFFMLTKQRPRVLMDGNGKYPQQRGHAQEILATSGLDIERVLAILDRGFQTDVSRRFQSASEFLGELERLITVPTTSEPVEDIPIERIWERLGTATERLKVDNLSTMESLMRSAASVVQEMSRESDGLLVQFQTAYQQGAATISSEYGLRAKTDENKAFSAVFSTTIHGSESIFTIEGKGMRRVRLRVPFGASLTGNDQTSIRRFFATGLDRVTDPKKKADVEGMREEILSKAIVRADEMIEKMLRSVTEFVADDTSGVMVAGSNAIGGTQSRVIGNNVIGAATVLGRLRNRDRYVRFNCNANIVPANHIDDLEEMRNTQEVTITITEGETGGGPHGIVYKTGLSLEPFSPSKEQLREALSTAMAAR